MDYTYPDIAKMVDHSLLNPVMTNQELEAGCRLAVLYDVASACVKPYFLKRCAELLTGSSVAASTVIGFPHGGNKTVVKAAGGVRTLDRLLEVRAIGVARSGATRTADMLDECRQRLEAAALQALS